MIIPLWAFTLSCRQECSFSALLPVASLVTRLSQGMANEYTRSQILIRSRRFKKSISLQKPFEQLRSHNWQLMTGRVGLRVQTKTESSALQREVSGHLISALRV